MKMEPTLRLSFEAGSRRHIGYEGKDILDYGKNNKNWIEKRGQHRETSGYNSRVTSFKAEDKKMADEIHMAERADEIKIQIQIEVDKELKIKEMEL